jgi:hypothetical protein
MLSLVKSSLVIDAVFARDNNSSGSKDVTQEESNNGPSTDDPDTPPAYQYERVHVKHELKHPLYNPVTLRYDIMLLQLDHAPKRQRRETGTAATTKTSFPFMRLDTGDALAVIEYNASTLLPPAAKSVQMNELSDVVDKNPNHDHIVPLYDDVLLALGWGHTQSSVVGTGGSSDTLQQAGLGLVSNPDCSQAHEGPWLTYSDRIFDEMMCTFSATRDTCYGKCGEQGIVQWHTYNL